MLIAIAALVPCSDRGTAPTYCADPNSGAVIRAVAGQIAWLDLTGATFLLAVLYRSISHAIHPMQMPTIKQPHISQTAAIIDIRVVP